jgi:hypothetical protein
MITSENADGDSGKCVRRRSIIIKKGVESKANDIKSNLKSLSSIKKYKESEDAGERRRLKVFIGLTLGLRAVSEEYWDCLGSDLKPKTNSTCLK